MMKKGTGSKTSVSKIHVWNGDQCLKQITTSLRTTLNWKAPGRDQIPNFWLKQLEARDKYLATLFNKLIEEDQTPEWLTAGVILLIPKNENTEKPKNYRPITCLPTIYKLVTSTINKWMETYIDDQNLMPKEQKGRCRGSKGCKDQLLMSKAILQEHKRRKKNLCMAWIDYQKDFDRVPHIWIIKSLELIEINNKIILFIKKIMGHWRTRMCVHTENKLIETEVPIPAAARSKAWVCGRALAGIVGSNPTGGMDVCLL
jgi:hypothetical protein